MVIGGKIRKLKKQEGGFVDFYVIEFENDTKAYLQFFKNKEKAIIVKKPIEKAFWHNVTQIEITDIAEINRLKNFAKSLENIYLRRS